jgi:ankyrin repeat protein
MGVNRKLRLLLLLTLTVISQNALASNSIDKPLLDAVLDGNSRKVETLLVQGANPNNVQIQYKKHTVIAWASRYKNENLLKLLHSYGADLNLYNPNNRSAPYPLYDAIFANRKGNLIYLLNNGANPNVVDPVGLSPIMLASTSGKWELIMLLLNSGADPKFKNKFGETTASYIEDAGLGTIGEDNVWRKKVFAYFSSKGIPLKPRVPL